MGFAESPSDELTPAPRQNSPHQHRAPVYVEDLASDESGVPGAEEQYRRGDLVRRRHPAQRNRGEDPSATRRIRERSRGHVDRKSTRLNAIDVNAMRR